MEKSKVLIVDDREENIIALEKILTDLPVEIIKASSGNQALSYLLENEVALVLMDVQMPDMDGFETVQLMRQDRALVDVPVIFVSAIHTDKLHTIKGIESGAVDFIVKPIVPEIIVGKVKIFVKIYENNKNLEKLNSELLKRDLVNKTIAYVTNSLVYPTLDLENISNIIISSINELTESEFSYLFIISRDRKKITRYDGKNNIIMDYPEDNIEDIWNYSLSYNNDNLSNENKEISDVLSQPVISREEVSGQIMLFNSKVGYTGQHVEVLEKLAALYGIAISRIWDEEDRIRLENDIRESEKFRVMGQLVGGIAHDFNNILSGILSSAQLLALPDRNLDIKSLKYVDIICNASERATELISKLLQFENKAVISRVPVSIHKVLDDSILLINRTLNNKVEIIEKRDSLNDVVYGNLTDLENIVLNLCINSSHAMEEGGIIEITTEDVYYDEDYCLNSSFEITPGNYCLIKISDSGHGIENNNISKIFEPFYTTKDVGQGSGLGLAVVYGTVQAHHGEILVESSPGAGTSFYISIPSTEESASEYDNREEVHISTGKILFADDEEINRILGEEILETMGYKTLIASNGIEAVEIYKRENSSIDLVILDMLMPGMNGSEVFYELKKIDPNVNVIIASGFIKDESCDKLRADGVSDFIQKPYLIEDLAVIIEKSIHN